MSDGEELERPEERRLRLFCALDPGSEAIAPITAWQREQGAGRGQLRPLAADALHMTLAFLGDRPESEVAAIAKVIEELRPGPIDGYLLPDPVPQPARKPRLFALGVDSPEAELLQSELSARLEQLGVFRPERRRFWPHLTVFRLRKRDSAGRSLGPLGRIEPLPGHGHAFGFVRVALYLSEIRPEGSKYSRLAANELPQTGGRQKR